MSRKIVVMADSVGEVTHALDCLRAVKGDPLCREDPEKLEETFWTVVDSFDLSKYLADRGCSHMGTEIEVAY